MIRVFIGYDPKEPIAFHVMAHSIMARASAPVSITPVALTHLKRIHDRERNPLQSTEFSFSRFLVPYLCDYSGFAIFVDCDQLMLEDVAKLWALRNGAFAAQCVQHDHRPRETTKFLGQVQTSYPKKNWSSVMILNCDRCDVLTPEYVNEASGLDLHRFNWTSERAIGALPPGWNHLVGYDDPNANPIHNLHFTEGGPWFDEYRNVPFAQEWKAEFDRMSSPL